MTFNFADLEVWAVTYGRHEPPMVESLWTDQYGAEQRAAELNNSSETWPWGTMGWTVRSVEE